MKVKKTIITSLIGLSTLTPAKAQKTVNLVSEAGVTGVVNKEASFYGGINLELPKGRNYTDFYAGVGVKPDKKASFQGLIINDFAWTKNISSWAREFFSISKGEAASVFEVAPIRANANIGKFNFSLSPSYALYNDFGTNKRLTTTHGISPILQMTYSISPNHKIFAEAKYSSEPDKNLFNTSFGKFKNNISYMISSLWKY